MQRSRNARRVHSSLMIKDGVAKVQPTIDVRMVGWAVFKRVKVSRRLSEKVWARTVSSLVFLYL